MKTYRIAPRELQNSSVNARQNSPKNSPKNTMSSKLRTVRSKIEPSSNVYSYGTSNLLNLFEYKNNGSKNREKKFSSPSNLKNNLNSLTNASCMNERKSEKPIGKNAKEFISEIADLRMFSTSLYAYIDNELFKLKQLKDSQFENIEKSTNEMIESI